MYNLASGSVVGGDCVSKHSVGHPVIVLAHYVLCLILFQDWVNPCLSITQILYLDAHLYISPARCTLTSVTVAYLCCSYRGRGFLFRGLRERFLFCRIVTVGEEEASVLC